MQLLINQMTQEIICVAIEKGRKHDFRIYKESQIQILEKIEIIADKGYQGLIAIMQIVECPIKSQKKAT